MMSLVNSLATIVAKLHNLTLVELGEVHYLETWLIKSIYIFSEFNKGVITYVDQEWFMQAAGLHQNPPVYILYCISKHRNNHISNYKARILISHCLLLLKICDLFV